MRAVPGVSSAALTTFVPLSFNYSSGDIYVEGQPAETGSSSLTAMQGSSSPDYFTAMGTPLLAGREFNDQDRSDTERVAIVNETFVRPCLPGTAAAVAAGCKRVSS